jgi:hypothetical protein
MHPTCQPTGLGLSTVCPPALGRPPLLTDVGRWAGICRASPMMERRLCYEVPPSLVLGVFRTLRRGPGGAFMSCAVAAVPLLLCRCCCADHIAPCAPRSLGSYLSRYIVVTHMLAITDLENPNLPRIDI